MLVSTHDPDRLALETGGRANLLARNSRRRSLGMAAGVLAVAFGPQRMRLVTHVNISAADAAEAVRRIDTAVGAVRA